MSGSGKQGISWGNVAGVALGALGLVPWFLDMIGVETSGALVPFLPALLAAWRVASPFALFGGGVILGWFVRDNQRARELRIEREEARLAAAERKKEAAKQRAARDAELCDLISGLDDGRIALLATAYTYGIFERDYDTPDATLLKGMAKLGLVKENGIGVLTGIWELTSGCRRAMEEMERDGFAP